jgi:hypothetical protein
MTNKQILKLFNFKFLTVNLNIIFNFTNLAKIKDWRLSLNKKEDIL